MLNLNFTDEDYINAGKDYSREILMIVRLAASSILQHLTPVAGLRGKQALPSFESNAEIGPYSATRKYDGSDDIVSREIETHLGSLIYDFEPNQYASLLIGKAAAIMGDAQAEAPSAKLVLAAAAKSVGEKLAYAIFSGVRKANGSTSKDLFDGYNTIISKEVSDGNISAEKGNFMQLSAITSANAEEAVKEMERSADDVLRMQDKIIYCDQDLVDKYSDAYLLTHNGTPYNYQFLQNGVEASFGKTTFCPLPVLQGTNYYIMTPQWNMLYGFDGLSNTEKFEVMRTSPFVLTMAMAMFFGVNFNTIDKRYFKVFKKASV